MAKRKYFLVVDTESTITDCAADFGAVIVDKNGTVHKEAGVLVRDFFMDRDKHPLFYQANSDPLWGRRHLPRRYAEYEQMVVDGRRVIASVAGVNRWLVQARLTYDPVWTAYNKAFDSKILANSGIDMSLFKGSFCLWHAAVAKWGKTKAFREFVLENHAFGGRTAKGNLTMRTNAEMMAAFIMGLNPDDAKEPHTALEDARDFEAPILARLVKTTGPSEYMNPPGYNWRHWQMRDHFVAR